MEIQGVYCVRTWDIDLPLQLVRTTSSDHPYWTETGFIHSHKLMECPCTLGQEATYIYILFSLII